MKPLLLQIPIASLTLVATLLLSPLPLHGEELFTPPVAGAIRERSVGDELPEVLLRNQTGGPLRLADFRGKAVAVTFFYSACGAATFCPLVSRNFDVAQGLLSRLGKSGDCQLLSITLDPERDTPEVLAGYAKGCEADPEIWSFASGDESEVRKLGQAVGLEYKREEGGQIDHNLRTVVLDRQGRIRRIFRGDAWTPQELTAELKAASEGRTQ